LNMVQNKIDELDELILAEYQRDAGVAYNALAEKLGLPTSTVFNRIKKMSEAGVIKNIVPIIDPAALGFTTTAWIRMGVDLKVDCCKVAEKLAENPKLLEVHEVAGDWDILAKVKARNNLELHDLAKELYKVPEVTRISTLIGLKTVKESHGLPIGEYRVESVRSETEE
jgi:Lrp/AsnC family leucine-responsive transcriptional regulator